MNQKTLWEKLAKKNSKYYIFSDKGKEITEKEFRSSGQEDYEMYFLFDDDLPAGGTCLEIGCGNGRMTEFIINIFDEVIGIDISGEMIRQAKERLKNISNIKLIETDGLLIPLPDSSVDFAFSYLVFQHFKSKEMVEMNFREVNRVLLKDGLFKVLLRKDKVNLESWWGGVGYNDEEINDLCQRTGFVIFKKEDVKNYGVWLWLKKI